MTEHDLIENHEHLASVKTYRTCCSDYCEEGDLSIFGICKRCIYKILAVLVCTMVVISYVMWYRLF